MSPGVKIVIPALSKYEQIRYLYVDLYYSYFHFISRMNNIREKNVMFKKAFGHSPEVRKKLHVTRTSNTISKKKASVSRPNFDCINDYNAGTCATGS